MIERYTDEGHPYRLILSLTSAFDEKRAALVPVGLRYAVADLAAAMRRHAAARGGPVHLAWVLMAGVNTGPEEARGAGPPVRGRAACGCRVIDVNDPDRALPAARTPRSAARFLAALAERGHRLRPALLRRPGHPRRLRDARRPRPRAAPRSAV